MLLPKIDRQDVWDVLLNPKADADLPPAEQEGVLLVRLIDLFVCPSDGEAHAASGTPALSYSVNAGAPDWNNSTFLAGPNAGDTTNNGVFLNLYEFAARRIKAPISRLSNVTDGAATTIMLSENCHKSYEPVSAGDPARFTWLFGTEQHLGIVWVVNRAPQPGNSIDRSRAHQCRQRRRIQPESCVRSELAAVRSTGKQPSFGRERCILRWAYRVLVRRNRLHRLPAIAFGQRPQMRRPGRSHAEPEPG